MCCVTERAATASGGEIMAPKTKPTASGKPASQWNRKAVAVIVTRTKPMARSRMGRKFARKSRQVVYTAAGYNNGGRNRSNTSSGSRRMAGTPGTSASTSPPTVNRIGYGILIFRAANASKPTATRQIKMNSVLPTIVSDDTPALPERVQTSREQRRDGIQESVSTFSQRAQ